MKKLLLILVMGIVLGMMTHAQNVPVCAADTTERADGTLVINEVLVGVNSIDNTYFHVITISRTRVDDVVLVNSIRNKNGIYHKDSTYALLHEGSWGNFLGSTIQNAVAPVSTVLLKSLGRNIFYVTAQDSLFVPRTY